MFAQVVERNIAVHCKDVFTSRIASKKPRKTVKIQLNLETKGKSDNTNSSHKRFDDIIAPVNSSSRQELLRPQSAKTSNLAKNPNQSREILQVTHAHSEERSEEYSIEALQHRRQIALALKKTLQMAIGEPTDLEQLTQ